MPTSAAKMALFFVLILTFGCRPEAKIQVTPAASFSGQAEVKSRTHLLPPTPPVKPSLLQEKTLLPTPTLHPQASPLPSPTTDSESLTVVMYAEESLPVLLDPAIEKAVATTVPPVNCDERLPGADLLTVVTKEFGLSRDFVPDDLVVLAGHVPYSVTLGYPSEVRQVVLEPLTRMIDEMVDAELRPQVLSGYRSYAAQAISWNKWNTLYPERAAIISAQPGHSEHQLGTVIDFGSPELPGLVGQPGIQFHTHFYKTSEGQWLAENAHKYGFTLSFTEEAFDATGFYYEPWHFRYVGEIMAERLREQNLTLTEYQLANEPPPCTP